MGWNVAIEKAAIICDEEAALHEAAGWQARAEGARGCGTRLRALLKVGAPKKFAVQP
jgi:hypothetical protein